MTLSRLRFVRRGVSVNSDFRSIVFRMVIDMEEAHLQTVVRLQAFGAGTLEAYFGVPDLGPAGGGAIRGKRAREVAPSTVRRAHKRARAWSALQINKPAHPFRTK